jgi:hypothetical protein
MLTKPPADLNGCIYCAGKRGKLPDTLEHIWPQSLGGSHGNEFFKTDQVCAKCNHDSGLWVDGGFVKSSFIQTERSFSELDYLDPKSDCCVSLIYMGHEKGFPCQETEICERWIGPSGDHIYYVHNQDSSKWHAHAGGNIIARKTNDVGRVYVRLVDQGEKRMIVSLRSIKKQFKKSRIHLLAQFSDPNFEINAGFITVAGQTDVEQTEISWIYARSDTKGHPIRLQVDTKAPKRFLAKLALGFGSKLLGADFLCSRDAEALRDLYWPNSGFNYGDQVRGIDFFGMRGEHASEILSWPSAWTLYFSINEHILSLTVITPTGRMGVIRIAELSNNYSAADLSAFRDGQLYVFIPSRKLCIGPISSPDFIAHKCGYAQHPMLETAESWLTETAEFLGPREPSFG